MAEDASAAANTSPAAAAAAPASAETVAAVNQTARVEKMGGAPASKKIADAVQFLLDPAVMGVPAGQLTPYLKTKLGLTDDEVKHAMKLSAEAPKPRPSKIEEAVLFLTDEKVRGADIPTKVNYMKQKLEMTDTEIKSALSKASTSDRAAVHKNAVAFLQSAQVKASQDNLAKVKYLQSKFGMSMEELQTAFKESGTDFPEMPKEEPAAEPAAAAAAPAAAPTPS